ncbi:hypothetical protein ACFV4F_38640 [Kitasatospora sp. NPDC059722]|uniref:hypothetical protein n=1 Tax=Kitasatospora sp. NPDC059722 TaxID=3346925 RepID=UPI0036769143
MGLSASHDRIWVGIDAGKGHHWAVVVDAAGDRGTQHAYRLVAVAGRAEDVVAGQLHRAVSDAVHPPGAEGVRAGGRDG